ncbi:MAG: hypothetical protein LM587_00175 [Candidatus Aenigmarchaeota archaeon]|nr:hypothetical protein [Candidatus Aenigmarchaeota archaeon]
MKLKILLPTLRRKRRYILFKVISEQKIEYLSFKELLISTFLKFYGEHTFARFDFRLLDERWNENEQIGIARCAHNFVPNTIVVFGLLQRLGDIRINVKILKISGTINSLLKNLRTKDKRK